MATNQDSNSETQDNKASRSAQELAILDEQIDAPPVNIPYWTLFRYTTTWDLLLLLLGSICATAGGAVLPIMTLLIGTLAGNFSNQFTGIISAIESSHNVARYSLYFIYLAIGEFITVAIAMATFSAVGEHVALRTREEYVKALLRQNIAYFDKAGAGEVASRASTDVNLIQDGVSEKVALLIMGLASFVSSLVVSFVESWRLALIAMSSIVVLVAVMGGVSRIAIKFKTKSMESQVLADNVVEEAVSSIRNVTAFGAQDKIARRYDGFLQQAEHWSFLNRTVGGCMMGLSLCVIYAEHALSFWQGSRFLVWRDISLEAVITVQLAIMLGGAYLGQSLPHIHSITSAIAAGNKIFAVIDRESPIDSQSDQGKMLDHIEGEIEFRDVRFAYPSRPEVTIFNGLDLILPAGKTTAVAGPSGCGKSTLVGLMERFYKPIAGTVIIDGSNLTTLNLRWWRQQVALVSQEPVLFSGTIFENIDYGLIGSTNENASKEDKLQLIIEAAKTSNAHDFITALPAGYDTQVGDAGRLLSGGQRQRIAIARAVVSNPKILLLDEATSNLGAASEAMVQAAIEKAARGRTTMIIAHKLSMVHNADKIIVISDGHIVEQGSHSELARGEGVYAELLRAQSLGARSKYDDEKFSSINYHDPASVVSERCRTVYAEKGEFLRVTSLSEKRSLPGEEHATKQTEHLSLGGLIHFMWYLNKAEKYSMLFGSLCSIINGGNQPVRGILFAHSILALSWPLSQSSKIRSESDFWAGMFLMLGLVQLVACSFQGLFFAKSSARLVRRAQIMAFRSILSQGIPYFDRLENSAGSLTSLLSAEASHIVGISGSTIGAILVFATTVFGSIGIALGFGWKLSLVGMSVMPMVITCGFIRFWLLAKFDKRTKQTTYAGSFVTQATASIRTVASLTMENTILQKYRQILISEAMNRFWFIIKSSIAYAFSQSFIFFAVALGFWYGGKLVARGEYDIVQFFICFTETLFGAQAAGFILSFAPEIGSGRGAVESFKKIIETPGVDLKSGEKVTDVQGTLNFRDVYFHYPERHAAVLQGFNLTAHAGQFTAIVGQSGSGKSTVLALIERFYEPTGGVILLDDQDTSNLCLAEYRQQLALVSQETTLYEGTIRENLLFDQDDIEDDALEAACKSANIYDFIASLPEGFSTRIGPKGTSLSGGQRQRLAIARALLRQPKILLLDEATSALDSASEEVVEEALKKASKGRTTIAIAHRLSSIQHADIIYVLDAGCVVECGTHSELLAVRGEYWKMVNLQSLKSK